MHAKNDEKSIENAMKFYENIKESLQGISEILNITLHENDFYHQAGNDNLKALNDNVLDLLKHFFTPREVRIKVREIEFKRALTH